MHFEMFQFAKRYLEAEGMSVIGGFMSPSHGDYVRKKLSGRNFFLGADRLNMIDAELKESTWIRGSGWELSQSKFVGNHVVWYFSHFSFQCYSFTVVFIFRLPSSCAMAS